MSTIAVSSFSLFSQLGPLNLENRTPTGELATIQVPIPRQFTLEEFAEAAPEQFGVNAIELCQIQFDDISEQRIRGLREALDKSGVSLLTMPIDIGQLDNASSAIRSEDIARITSWLDIAQALGATYVRVNAGSPSDAAAESDWYGLVTSLKHLSEAAAARGLKLLVENHGGRSSDPDYLLALQDEVGSDRLGILLDLGNFEPLVSISHQRLGGANPDTTGLDTAGVYDNIAKLAPVASLVHAKAFDPGTDGNPLLDVDRALRIVAESGYCGPISVEWEGREGNPWNQARKVLESVRGAFPGHEAPAKPPVRSPESTSPAPNGSPHS